MPGNLAARTATLFLTLWVAGALLACEGRPKPDPAARSREATVSATTPSFPRTQRHVVERAGVMVQKGEVLAVSVAVVDGSRVAWSAGFGSASAGNAAKADTVYRVGSLAKPVLAAAVLQRVEAGAWALDDALSEHLTGLDTPATLRDVLTHRSGLPADDLALAWAGPDAPWRDLAERIADRPASSPGRALAYSNVAFALLGRALELDAGAAFEEHMRGALLEPLGMSTAAFGRPIASHAVPVGPELDAGLVPAAGLTASARDMGRFLAMVMGGGTLDGKRVLEPGSVGEMLRVQNAGASLDLRTRVGLAWQRDPPRLAPWAPVVWHDGQVPGYRAVMVGLPRHGLGVVVLATTVTAPEAVTDFAFEILEQAAAERGLRPGEPGPRVAAPKLSPVEDPIGAYMMQHAVMKVVRDGDGLRVEPPLALVPQLPAPPGDDGRLARVDAQTYRRAADGLTIHFARRDGVDVIVGERDGDFGRLGERIELAVVPAAWRARAGTWVPASEGWFGFERVELAVEDGYLTLAHDSTWGGPPGERIELALVPTDDDYAVVAGIGRGKGDSICTRREGVGEILRWQGLDMRRAGD